MDDNSDEVIDYLIEMNKGNYKSLIANMIGHMDNKDSQLTKIHKALGTNSHIAFYDQVVKNMEAAKKFKEVG